MEIKTQEDVHRAFKTLGKTIWLRLKEGGGGAGSAPVSDIKFANIWINHFHGWGKFIASEMLSPDSITWSSIWENGKLVVAQSRKRLYWLYSNRTLSGVTGITGAALTVRDRIVDRLAQRAIRAIDPKPHGIFSVDMTYDFIGHLRLTEINIGRFFTTIHFFTEAGLNMPDIFVRLAFGQKIPTFKHNINPLPSGLIWVRGMDTAPVLTSTSVIEGYKKALAKLKKEL
jgi:carbamoyl-phosphate synthase large subunit